MGKLITFWSPCIGQAKVTSTMCAIAGALGIQYPEMEIAISHTKPESMELEERLDCRSYRDGKKALYEKSGLQALALNYRQAVLTSEKIRRCAIPLLMKPLYLFPGLGKQNPLDDVVVQLLTDKLVKEFQAVFLDLESGWKEASMYYMEKADRTVIVLPQNPGCWERFFKENAEWLGKKERWIILGGCLEGSKYSPGYFAKKREFKTGGTFLGAIPVNAGYMDAMAEGRTLEFFFRNELSERHEENYEFITQAKKAAECFRKNIFLS